ncbi:fimbria/pilus outer membrane usher protein [Neptunicoccus cionae]|uniref:Fimbrial protein n=1 Tax=Neptunicoccus cionae TaxID=2035344 RepID=A0A916VPR4_9RHOB|nr:fimbria/pilus outer membrane usher protein [Amylibacter cionae]GGA16748.1 fimbrial protein [Amylibacter cionae]
MTQQISADIEVSAEISASKAPYELVPPVQDTPLFLEVYVNSKTTQLIAEFTHHTDNRFSSPRSELEEIGIRPPLGVSKTVYLDTIEGLTFRYNMEAQAIYISAPFRSLLPIVSSARRKPEMIAPERSFGAVVNYALTANLGPNSSGSGMHFRGYSGSLNGWVFAPFGALSSSGFFNSPGGSLGTPDFIRQETKLEFNNTKHALSLSFGDLQSSSVSWSRPIRMGGIQFRRDFSLRSDIVTEQLFSFEGAAAVPSTVDVFIENNRAYSGTVDQGRFRLEDVPFFTGSGDAVVVIRDANGNERLQEISFFAAQNLLKAGTFDFSVEVGKPREAYGLQSNEYSSDTAYSGSFKYGLNQKLTLEAHLEGKSDLIMGGIGFTTVPFDLAEFSLSAGLSRYKNNTAAFAQTSLRTKIRNVDVHLNVLRSEPGFADLAYATGVDYLGASTIATGASLLEFPIASEVLSLGMPLFNTDQDIGLSLVRSERASSEDLIVSASYARSLDFNDSSISLFGSHNVKNDRTRLAINFAMPLHKKNQIRTSAVSDSDGDLNMAVSLSRPLGDRVGDYGYQAQIDDNGDNRFANVRGSYRTRFAKVSGELFRTGSSDFARFTAEGSLVLADGKVAAGNVINDSFAIVDVGVPNVDVNLQNRPVTKTGRFGRALVTGLASYRRNRVSVDTEHLPQDAVLNASAMEVVPARRSGTLVSFASGGGDAALITLVDQAGRYVTAGSAAYLNGSKSEYYVGYDGLVWVENIKSSNRLRVTTEGRDCTVAFDYQPTDAVQQSLGPFRCQ